MRWTLMLSLCIALAACSVDDEDPNDGGDPVERSLISFGTEPNQPPPHEGYSAFDGDVHTYQVVAWAPSATDSDSPTSINPEPIDRSSLVWTVDDRFLSKEAFPDIDGAILLTTRRAGTTVVKVAGKTLSGTTLKSSASLVISQADADQWTEGNERYAVGTMIDVDLHSSSKPDNDASACSLPSDALPTTTACANCHDENSNPALTPAQTAGYSDDDLIQIFSMGMKPAGYTFTSNILTTAPMPDCTFAAFHTWTINDDTKKGLIWKLRSITPRPY